MPMVSVPGLSVCRLSGEQSWLAVGEAAGLLVVVSAWLAQPARASAATAGRAADMSNVRRMGIIVPYSWCGCGHWVTVTL
ncbi:MAG: hypothetical protein V9G10_00670 [Candidatus Nanopelagicales bacterium]